MKAAKSYYENNLIWQFTDSNNNNVYKYIANLTKSHSIPDTMTDGITIVTSDLDIANCFNKYFYSVFTKSNYTDPSEDTSPSFAPDIDNIFFSITDVFNILSTLNTSKAMGIDYISPKLLKDCA